MGGPPSKRSLCLFWHETKQRPELEIFDETGSGQENAREGSWKKEPREGSWHRGDTKGQSTTDSRRDQSGEIESRGSEEDRQDELTVPSRQRSTVRKMVRDELAFLVACRSFAKTTRQR